MRHKRNIIFKSRFGWEEYGQDEEYVRFLANTLESKVKLSGGWTVASLIDEAFAQATTLAWDFDDSIFFDNNYFSASLNKMPLNVANTLYSVVYIIIRDLDWMGNVCRMMEEKLSSKPVFRTLKALPHRDNPFNLYPRTDYFDNADFVSWKLFTRDFQPEYVRRVMKLAETYDYHPMVAKGILGQLRAFAIENNKVMENSIADAEAILRPYMSDTLIWSLAAGDSANESMGYGFPFVYGATIQEDTPETLAKLSQTQQELEETRHKEEVLRNEIARVEKEKEDHIRETEQYKKSLVEIKQQLGRSSISLNTIAECILRFPSFDLQYNAFQQISSILVGTPWSDKAQEVLEAMFKMVNREKKKTVINIENFTNNGVINEISSSSVQIEGGSASNPQIEQ